MARSNYTQGKRQREADKARKKRDKASRRDQRREEGPAVIEVVMAEDIVGNLPTPSEAMRAMEERARAPRSAAALPCRLFVGGLNWDTTVDTLRGAFEQFGKVSEAVILMDRGTGRSRGFGFVTLQNRKDAPRTVEQLDGSELDGRTIVVNVATER
jgi:hypothetical protein